MCDDVDVCVCVCAGKMETNELQFQLQQKSDTTIAMSHGIHEGASRLFANVFGAFCKYLHM